MAKKKAGKMKSKKDLGAVLQSFFQTNPSQTFSFKQIFKMLKLKTHPEKMLAIDIMEEMAWDDFLTKVSENAYRLNTKTQLQEGVFRRKTNGKNSFIPDDGSQPIFVAERNSMSALDGDRVQVAFMARRTRHMKEAMVTAILQRARETFVGKLIVEGDIAFLQPQDNLLPYDILISKNKLKGGTTGEKAVVKIIQWPDDSHKNMIGEVVDVLGEQGNNDVEMHAILAQYGLPYRYPKHVEEAAEKISAEITEQDLAEREDFRDVFTCTIDPKDAKDFDDALSIRKLRSEGVKECRSSDNTSSANNLSTELSSQELKGVKGSQRPLASDASNSSTCQLVNSSTESTNLWEVGVHIADVSHYVTEGSVIDKEALKRATSVYLVDRTIPMLPERLCNFICSLRPDEDKLAYSVIFEMDDEAVVHNWRLVHTVIRSNRRYAYEEVQAMIDESKRGSSTELSSQELKGVKGGQRPLPSDASNLSTCQLVNSSTESSNSSTESTSFDENTPMLLKLDALAKKLREARFKNGAVKFDREELRFDVDETGKPIGCYFKKSLDANQLIEEFMLLANRTVAEGIGKVKKGTKAKTLPYRIHDQPDQTKLETLREFVVKFGYKLKTAGTKGAISKSLNALMDDCNGQREQKLIETVALRAMMKAKYSTHNIGHYGLAFDYYTHFTSPIRRYPDTMVHRLLTRYQQGGRSANQDYYEDLCKHSTDMEIIASNAERDSIKYKMVEFMSDKVGNVYDAHISGIQSYGIYCEIDDNHCEGLVSMRDLDDDYYDFDERNYCLVGRRHHHKYQLGDPIRIKVASTNLEKKQIDFVLEE